jgi:hypothetical protein
VGPDDEITIKRDGYELTISRRECDRMVAGLDGAQLDSEYFAALATIKNILGGEILRSICIDRLGPR